MQRTQGFYLTPENNSQMQIYSYLPKVNSQGALGERKTVLTIIYINKQSKRKEILCVLFPNMQNKSICDFYFATFFLFFFLPEKTFSGWGYMIWGSGGVVSSVQ